MKCDICLDKNGIDNGFEECMCEECRRLYIDTMDKIDGFVIKFSQLSKQDNMSFKDLFLGTSNISETKEKAKEIYDCAISLTAFLFKDSQTNKKNTYLSKIYNKLPKGFGRPFFGSNGTWEYFCQGVSKECTEKYGFVKDESWKEKYYGKR